jgi:hypothetical protein
MYFCKNTTNKAMTNLLPEKITLKSILLFSFLFFSYTLFGQVSISGKTIDSKTKEPIAGANLFINNSTYKTISDKDGNFSLTNINIQKGELIINALGYKYKLINIENKTITSIVVELEQQAKDLDAVIIKKFEPNGFKKWGKLFTDNFIGNTAEAEECSIENEKVIKFYFDKKTRELEAIANEPIIIKNKALGYVIEYTLESFVYNTKTRILSYGGYPVFTEMKGNNKKTKRWQSNRNESYNGSIMHFMRSLYRNKLETNGFSIYNAKKVLNKEKARLKEIIKKRKAMGAGVVIDMANIYPPDSTDYYQKIMSQEDSLFAILSKANIDSIAFAIDSVTAGLFFENYLMVNYLNKNITHQTSAYNHQHENPVQSYIKLLAPEDLQIFANGNYYNSYNLFSEQYWANFEKAARLLPFDFVYKE